MDESCRTRASRTLVPVLLCLAIFAAAGETLRVHPACAMDTTIYHADENGVMLLTNRRTSPNFKVFMVFRDIMREFPNVKKSEIIRLATKHGRSYGLDPHLVQAVIEVESGWRINAVSSAGAEGLMQIMPKTQKELGVRKPFDPEDNIAGGVKYLSRMLERFGKLELALAAYNAGPQRVEEFRGIPPYEETREYVKKVLARYAQNKAAQ